MLIGINGQSKSGKDTVADYICDQYEYIKIALADPMKVYAKNLFKFSESQLWGPQNIKNKYDLRYHIKNDIQWQVAARDFHVYSEMLLLYLLGSKSKKEYGSAYESLHLWFIDLRSQHTRLSPRIMLQSLGSWGRNFDQDLWVNALLKRVNLIKKPVVVPDVRFSNEMKKIKNDNGLLIRVKRSATDQEAANIGIKNHSSETEQQSFTDDMFDKVLQNDGTLIDLYKNVDLFMNENT